MKYSTRCVHSTDLADPYGAISPPIYQTATFRQPTATEFGEYDYTRSGITALTRLVEQGEEIIAGDDLYGGTVRLLEKILPRQGIAVRYVDTTDLGAVQAALTAQTRLILIETPSNPLLRISDIRALAEIARAERVWLAVDNSMLSPCLQRPLTLGADLVIHSATKFLCGHSDVTAGAVITNDPALHKRIAFQQNAEGAGLSPFESWLLLRGMKTLALRVERQNESAFKVAQFLELEGQVRKVYHPGFKNHSGHEIHRRQADGDGAVVTFTTGDEEFSKRIVEATKLFTIAVSFGSVGSTISLPYRMSHASIPETLKDRLAPPADLVRLSVGIEDANDLIEDLRQAFTVAVQLREEAVSASY